MKRPLKWMAALVTGITLAFPQMIHPEEICPREGRLIFMADSSPVTGHVQTYYPDGTVKSDFQVVDGKLEGKSLLYFENGSPHWELTYRNNLLQDTIRIRYADGSLRAIGDVDSAGMSIDWTWWNKDGQKMNDPDDKGGPSHYGKSIEFEVDYPEFLFTKSCGIETEMMIHYNVDEQGYIQWTKFRRNYPAFVFNEAVLFALLSEDNIPYHADLRYPYDMACMNTIRFYINPPEAHPPPPNKTRKDIPRRRRTF